MSQLTAFVGFKASGKNTAAQPLVADRGVTPLSFADAMKDSLAAIFCWERNMLEGVTDESRVWREEVDGWWANRLNMPHFTPRWAMQNFGTDVMREHFHPEIWVLNVERRILLLGAVPIVLIDARFPNEIALAIRLGGQVVRVQRGADPTWMAMARAANQGDEDGSLFMAVATQVHRSEWAWVGSKVDATLQNDGTIADLQRRSLQWHDSQTGDHMRQ